jgi:hypothetical protein
MNIRGQDGGYAPVAPGPIDAARRKNRHQYTKKVKRPIRIVDLTKIIHSLQTSTAKITLAH